MPDSSQDNERPLLSISIPTYNRAVFLDRLLTILREQAAGDARVEVTVSDNASTDETPQVVARHQSEGLAIRYVHNAENVGGDENIRRCYALSRGTYAWIFGDDDALAPGALARLLPILESRNYSLIFLAPYGFEDDPTPPKSILSWPGAYCETSDPCHFVKLVHSHSDFIFISSIIVDKELTHRLQPDDFTGWANRSIVQYGWICTALTHFKRGLFIDDQLVGGQFENAGGGYDTVRYFCGFHVASLEQWMPAESGLQRCMTNAHLTMWGCSWPNLRRRWPAMSKLSRESSLLMSRLYGRRAGYWLVVYPLTHWPLPLAQLYAIPWMARRKLLRLWWKATTRGPRQKQSTAK